MEYTVSKLNTYIKNMFASEMLLSNITVTGEIADCKYHYSGHVYFTLKDEKSQVACVMFATNAQSMTFRMKQGDQVNVTGTVSVFERDGKYQLYAKRIDKAGMGELFLKYEAMKKRLEAEGLFDESIKKPIPQYAKKVGIVTAQTGAAIQDIIKTAKSRNPYVSLYLRPSQVQGVGAAKSIADGIRFLDKYGLDVIIVGRGGGSIEDLWAFNEEEVARAIYECETPIISGVGHETDFTIADFVADLRCVTPTAAAHAAVFDYDMFIRELQNYYQIFDSIMTDSINSIRIKLSRYNEKLMRLGPEGKLNAYKARTGLMSEKLDNIMNNKITRLKYELSMYIQKLNDISPLKRLSQGYGYVTDSNDCQLTGIDGINEEDIIRVTLKDGQFDAKVVAKKKLSLRSISSDELEGFKRSESCRYIL